VKPSSVLELGRDPAAPEWCLVCFTRHPVETKCRGDHPVTGPERAGWKAVVETPHSMEAFGVLVAPAGEIWRARILTYPRSLWTVPGGHGVMKFFGKTPQLAEAQAIRFIEDVCARRGYTLRHGLELSAVARARGALAPTPEVLAAAELTTIRPRWPIVLPVLYGVDAMTLRAVTRNVSEGGLFVQTPSPIARGRDVSMQVTLTANRLALSGTVVWCRSRLQPGRPPGMGIQLIAPSRAFLEYIRTLPPPSPVGEE
jgi:uncharacterized protein (TIGR02266 family)